MTEEAKSLPVRSVLDVMEEDSVLERCILGLNKCSEAKPCPMHSQYKLIKQQLITLFETKTIMELASDIRDGEAFINND
jgi:DNA-binding IscR family transcriptional regulator